MKLKRFYFQSLYYPNWWYYSAGIPWFLRPLAKRYHLRMKENPIYSLYWKLHGPPRFPEVTTLKKLKRRYRRQQLVNFVFGVKIKPTKPIVFETLATILRETGNDSVTFKLR